MVKELCEHFDSGEPLGTYPWQMLDENKWLAARHGLEGELVDLPSSERVATRALARRLVDRLREHAQDLGSAGELEAIDDLLRRGNGAQRQVVVYEANHDLREVMAEIVARDGALARARTTVESAEPCPARPISSSSARTAATRSARTSRSARTAGRACASARRRSSATAACRTRAAARAAAPRRRGCRSCAPTRSRACAASAPAGRGRR